MLSCMKSEYQIEITNPDDSIYVITHNSEFSIAQNTDDLFVVEWPSGKHLYSSQKDPGVTLARNIKSYRIIKQENSINYYYSFFVYLLLVFCCMVVKKIIYKNKKLTDMKKSGNILKEDTRVPHPILFKNKKITVKNCKLIALLIRPLKRSAVKSQARAWLTVYEYCIQNGMNTSDFHSGIENVINFIEKK